MTAKMLQLPYGKCDFKTIVKQNYYFVDKTRYLKSVFQDDPSQVQRVMSLTIKDF